MHNKKPHIQSVGKIHKVLFDYLVGTGVRTSAITQDGNCPCIGILFPEVIVPDPFDVLADKLRGAVADSHCHITDIPCYIVYAVWHERPVTERAEVMVVRPQASIRECLARSFEVTERFLLLGVDADDRDAGLLQRLAYGCDVLELLVPVLDVSHRDVLAERTLPKAKMIKYLSDMVPGDFISRLGKFAPDLCLADGDPSHGLILRKAGHVGLYDPDHRPQPFRMLGQRGVTASSVPADASFPERVAGMQFLQPFLKSVRADSHIFAKFAVAESSGLEAFRPRGKKQSSVPFIQTRHVSQLCWREYFWRRFRMHPYNSWLFYKDTKLSPDLLYYIIDNQIINLIFYAASPKRNQASFDSDSRGRNRHLMAA